MSYSTYRHGLRKGDLVNFDIYNKLFSFRVYFCTYNNCTILKRNFLFKRETRYGIRTFWEYEGLYNSNVIKFKTQDIKIVRVLSCTL